ncbi:MAG: energy transducer TonB [Flavobacterium sp.]|jgi:hypothetical protein|uniref:energy transducer TonB n=1 Tax=Flavobacterium sp. TaxID=239 RepID=UPI0022C273C7|nr:energy transducer TonB [Flavobacterium sp.]MCZ8167702.1 energy transducer TonB [Flavobacterium sp.]MCZ8295764.1 energy transducer TonB [Flavobacterium sp.]
MNGKVLLFFFCLSNCLWSQVAVYSTQEVTTLPSFPGGPSAYQEYMLKSIKPNYESLSLLKYRTLDFVVLADGSISELKLLGSRSTTIDDQVVEALTQGPKWQPAILRGTNVACRLRMPVFPKEVLLREIVENSYEDSPVTIPAETESAVKNEDYVYNVAEIDVKPEFPGGLEKLYLYLKKNFKVPNIKDLKGKVFVTFIVEKNGKLSNINVLRDIGHGTKEEALRVLRNCPNWKPGIYQGKNVRVQYTIPINVNIEMPKPTTIKE